MTSLELLQEIDAWLSFNNSPSKEQISELRNDIKKHISEQLNILPVSNRRELLLSAICQFTKRNTQKEIQEVEKWIETDFRK